MFSLSRNSLTAGPIPARYRGRCRVTGSMCPRRLTVCVCESVCVYTRHADAHTHESCAECGREENTPSQ